MTCAEHGDTRKELGVDKFIVRVRKCFNACFKIYYFSYQSLNGICKVQRHIFLVFIGISLIENRPCWPSRCVHQVQNYG